MTQTAIITGITGQTGSYLADVLLEKGYKVYGLKRRASTINTERIDHLYVDPHKETNLELVYGDLADYSSIVSIVADVKPDMFFNMAAQSHVRVSFDIPEYTMDVTGNGVMRCLEAIRKYSPNTRFLQASSSELFGSSPPPQNEQTRFQPRSPYAVAKAAGYYATVNYREAYNLFACNTICFNHESPRRAETFVTRKITKAASRIKLGLQDFLWLGNLESKRDWGHAKDYAKAMYLVINSDHPDDYVVSTGQMHSVKEFVKIVFDKLDLDWTKYVKFDPKYLRPSEVDALLGDSSKLRNTLGWKPEYDFNMLVDEMIERDMQDAKKEQYILNSKL